MEIFTQYIITFGWALTAAVSMAIAIGVGLKIFTWISPLNEWDEVKNGNLGMAAILVSVILGMAIVVALTINARL
ncbi:DUF350 domain-containing protein [Candidatus Kaiserbacteria bacterium]|nr:MAG: DUF350 domain-containing protein [Candidatus Kaiserbacteria bacterium]